MKEELELTRAWCWHDMESQGLKEALGLLVVSVDMVAQQLARAVLNETINHLTGTPQQLLLELDHVDRTHQPGSHIMLCLAGPKDADNVSCLRHCCDRTALGHGRSQDLVNSNPRDPGGPLDAVTVSQVDVEGIGWHGGPDCVLHLCAFMTMFAIHSE